MYPEINKNKCIVCLCCIEVCPYEVFSEEKGVIIVKFPEKCIECGECIRNCKEHAIQLVE